MKLPMSKFMATLFYCFYFSSVKQAKTSGVRAVQVGSNAAYPSPSPIIPSPSPAGHSPAPASSPAQVNYED